MKADLKNLQSIQHLYSIQKNFRKHLLNDTALRSGRKELHVCHLVQLYQGIHK